MDEPQFSIKDNGLTTVYKNAYGLTTSKYCLEGQYSPLG